MATRTSFTTTCIYIIVVLLLIYSVQCKRNSMKGKDSSEPGKKRANTKADSASGAATKAGASTGAATASDSSSESQTFTNTKVNTKISTKSNARSGANAAAKVKTFAHANTETKVDTQQQKPTPPPETPALTTPNGDSILPPPGGKDCNCASTPTPDTKPIRNSTKTPKPPIINVFCPPCPCPCPPPCPCICPCAPPPPPPPPPPPCPIPCPVPCPCQQTPCSAPPCPQLPQDMICPVDCTAPPCPCIYKRSDTNMTRSNIHTRRDVEQITERTERQHNGASKRVHASGKQPNLAYAKPLEFNKAAVAADNEKCSQIGVEILKSGGTAADAIVSTHCCVEVVNSHSTGLGGGGFMVYYDKKSGTSKAYDFRETLPAAYTDSQNKTQGETILVPGVLRGLEAVWKDFGKLPWSDLWQPCIKLAKEGFYIHEALAAGIEKKSDFILANLGLRELYAPDGAPLQLGEKLQRPKLARTYEKIAKHGADYFYQGEMADTIIDDLRQAGGVMTKEDLAKYQVVIQDPLKTKINNFNVLSVPSPGSGALLLLSLKIMSKFNWKPKDFMDDPALVYHQMIEAFKLAYAPTTFLGDPRFTPHAHQVEQYMLNDTTAEDMFNKIDKNSHDVKYYKPYSTLYNDEKTGTSHMSLLDTHGSAVSVTSSINAYFGSKLRSRDLGFIYNNDLADFAEFWPTIYNLTSDKKIPYKRPVSKSMPNIWVKNKKVHAVFGAAGGFFIPSAVGMTIANWLFFNDNLKVAVSRPRLHCQLFPPTVVYEPTLPPPMVAKIKEFGHQSVTNNTYDVSGQSHAIMGVVQAIVRLPNGKVTAECDYRKGGKPAGI